MMKEIHDNMRLALEVEKKNHLLRLLMREIFKNNKKKTPTIEQHI